MKINNFLYLIFFRKLVLFIFILNIFNYQEIKSFINLNKILSIFDNDETKVYFLSDLLYNFLEKNNKETKGNNSGNVFYEYIRDLLILYNVNKKNKKILNSNDFEKQQKNLKKHFEEQDGKNYFLSDNKTISPKNAELISGFLQSPNFVHVVDQLDNTLNGIYADAKKYTPEDREQLFDKLFLNNEKLNKLSMSGIQNFLGSLWYDPFYGAYFKLLTFGFSSYAIYRLIRYFFIDRYKVFDFQNFDFEEDEA